MTKNNTPVPEDSNEVAVTNAEETFSSSEAVTSGNAPQAVKNKWLIPSVAFASAALLAGALGFALGSNNSQDMRPVAMAGQAFGQNNGLIPGHQKGQGDSGLNQPGQEMNRSNGQGRHGSDNQGQGKQGQGMQRGPGEMMPGNNQKLPHCHDASGNDVDSKVDGTCVDGSTPGFMGGQNTTPAPSTSSSTTLQ